MARHLAEWAVRVAEPLGDYLRVSSTGDARDRPRSRRRRRRRPAADAAGRAAGRGRRDRRVRARDGAGHGTPAAAAQDDPEAAASWFGREARSANRGTETWLVARVAAGLGAALISLGRLDQAHDVLDRVVAVATPTGHAARPDRHPRAAGAPGGRRQRPGPRDRPPPPGPGRAGRARVAHLLRRQPRSAGRAHRRAEPTPEAVRSLAANDAARLRMAYPRDPARRRAHRATVAGLRAPPWATARSGRRGPTARA